MNTARESNDTPRGFAAGLLTLGVAAGASILLTAEHLFGAHLPGCGAESACGRAAASAWGSVPGLDWPTSFVGTSYFLGLLAAFALARGELSRNLIQLARMGAVGSLVLLGAMLQGGYLCPYCIAVHVGNLAFVLVAAPAATRAGASARPGMVAFLAVALAAGGVLLPLETRRRAERERIAEGELAGSVSRAAAAAEDVPFTGRYRSGPAEARIRIVAFTDYQCPDCRKIEAQIEAVLAARDDVSFSVKHFPFCTDCNRRAVELDSNRHRNACWAARAAEAAGILGGADGFLRMHRWLFQEKGAFDQAKLAAGLAQLGFRPSEFHATMRGPETLRRVEADIEEGIALGLRQTPMIFLNGVELRGWSAPQAVVRAVDELAASELAAAGADDDRPPAALEWILADWEAAEPRALPAPQGPWTLDATGPGSGGATVVVWGDYLEPATRELDRAVRAALGEHPEASYSFRSFPLEKDCNPSTPRTLFPGACLPARAALAAGSVGGADAFRRMHARLLDGAPVHDRAALLRLAAELGLEADAFRAALDAPDTLEWIRTDAAAARRLGLRSVPFVFVDGRPVPHWKQDGEQLIGRFLDVLSR